MSEQKMKEVCPVCGSASAAPMLEISGQPLYQHPVPADCTIDPPWTIDLAWLFCNDCQHSWQPHVDQGALEKIYRQHYYTQAPDGIAVEFQQSFIDQLSVFGLARPKISLLEIGGATGDTLFKLSKSLEAARACMFEPNTENAAIGRQRGLEVKESFFGVETSTGLGKFDLIFSRHVIEHLFDFDDFFAGLDQACAADADLVLETPSLDWHVASISGTPFHVEHVHVFSQSSLARLCENYGWGLLGAFVSPAGNLICWFRKGVPGQVAHQKLEVSGWREHLIQQRESLVDLCAGHKLIFWGAGSASVIMASRLGRDPDYWVDSNPNKHGKRFVGYGLTISDPETAIAEAMPLPEAERPLLLITSSFEREILPTIRRMGWTGPVFSRQGKMIGEN